MTISVYKAGSTHDVRGVMCEMHRLPNAKLEWALANGYFLRPEHIDSATPVATDDTAIADDDGGPYGGMSETELRIYAKDIGIKSSHNKRPDTLLDEIHALHEQEDD